MAPAGLDAGERSTYGQGAEKGRAAYLRKHGAPSVGAPTRSPALGSPERAELAREVHAAADAWWSEHGHAFDAQAHAYGMRAVRKWWADRGMTDRLEAYAAPKRSRAAVARPAVVVEVATPAVEVVAESVTVPEPMPRMTRAARKASNRELAAAMRAAGVAVTAETWAAAKAGTLAEVTR